jgi:hypothetical protein
LKPVVAKDIITPIEAMHRFSSTQKNAKLLNLFAFACIVSTTLFIAVLYTSNRLNQTDKWNQGGASENNAVINQLQSIKKDIGMLKNKVNDLYGREDITRMYNGNEFKSYYKNNSL